VATALSEIDDIRRRMAQIRRELHADVQNVVEGAEAATDWRRYVRSYPWATLGLALAAGFLIVPRRRSSTTIQVTPGLESPVGSAEARKVLQAEAPRVEVKEKKGKGLLGTAFGMLAPVALRAAQGYALQFFEQWMAQKMAQQIQNHPELAAAFAGQSEAPRGPQARPPGAPRF